MPGNKIIDLIIKKQNENDSFISFEFFPPKTDDGVKSLMERIERYKHQDGLFMDMTWGAGGSTSDLTLDLCVRMNNEIGVESNMHLTCTNMDKEKVDIALEGAKKANIRNIVALRGDPPHGQEKWSATEGGFTCALDLVKYIREQYGDYFCITVSGYPEGHCDKILKVEEGRTLTPSELGRCVNMEDGVYVCSDEDFGKEMDYLEAKIQAGADLIITQMVFDAQVYESFVAACRARGINVPILPGIMCIQNQGGFNRMTTFCKSRFPKELKDKIDAAGNDKDAVREVAIDFGKKLCQDLQAAGAPGLHFYTLNLEKVTLGILEALDLKK